MPLSKLLRTAVVLLPLFSFSSFMFAQHCSLQEVPLEQRISAAESAIEGLVLSKESFWNTAHTNIFTAYSIQVVNQLKGSTQHHMIDLILPGGFVGLDGEVLSPNASLEVGDKGIFLLKSSEQRRSLSSSKKTPQYELAAWPQGILKFDPLKKTLTDDFSAYQIDEARSHFAEQGQSAKDLILADALYASDELLISKTSAITSFSPATASAGTQTTLTISGSGFGAAEGLVFFSSADAGGGGALISAPSALIQSWSDTQVVVHVPSGAGTGIIAIQPAGGGALQASSASLFVPYAINTVLSDALNPGTFQEYNLRHVNQNGSGGYTWQMHTDFDSNTDAKSAFERGMETWICESSMNWVVGPSTPVDVIANDGTNVCRWDNGTELNGATGGAVGVATTYFSGCFVGGTLNWYVSEIDIVFDFENVWNFGPDEPNSGESDFETIALHELGHTYLLGHVIDDGNDVMHYSLLNGTSIRTPNANNLVATGIVQARSNSSAVCSQSAMIDLACTADCPADFNDDGLVDIDDFLDFNTAFGTSCAACEEDLNGDGIVDIDDFLDFNTAFGTTCP